MKSYSVFRVAYKVKKINFIPRACNEYALHRIAVLSAIPRVSRTVLRAGRQAKSLFGVQFQQHKSSSFT